MSLIAPVSDLRHAPRHGRASMTADQAAARLQCLIDCGFTQAQADHVYDAIDLPPVEVIEQRISDLTALGFDNPVKMITSSPAILGYAIDNIRGKISDLTALGFDNPVKMITSSPAILGYAPERLRLVAGIVANLDDRRDSMVMQIISKRRTVIDAVAAANPKNWADVRAVLSVKANAAIRRPA